MSLLPGLFFTLAGLGFLAAASTELRIDVDWLAPVVLIGVGVVTLLATGLAGGRRSAEHRPQDQGDREPHPVEDE